MKIWTCFPQNGRFGDQTEGREITSQNGNLPFKTAGLEHMPGEPLILDMKLYTSFFAIKDLTNSLKSWLIIPAAICPLQTLFMAIFIWHYSFNFCVTGDAERYNQGNQGKLLGVIKNPLVRTFHRTKIYLSDFFMYKFSFRK